MSCSTTEVIRKLKRDGKSYSTTFEAATQLITDCGLHWRVDQERGEGRYAFAVISYDRDTQETWLVIWMECCRAPLHRHLPGGLYGELNYVLSGVLRDRNGPVVVTTEPGEFSVADEGTTHAPWTEDRCLLITHHPRGVELLE